MDIMIFENLRFSLLYEEMLKFNFKIFIVPVCREGHCLQRGSLCDILAAGKDHTYTACAGKGKDEMLRMDHFNFNVLNQEKSLEFYRQALDFVPKRTMEAADGSFRLVFIGNDDAPFCLELTWLRDRTEPYDLGEGEIHLGIVTDRFEEMHRRHEQMGIICFENTQLGVYFIEDPDGYWIEIIPERK